MRTFTCLTIDGLHTVPTLSFILASDEKRARTIARRQMFETKAGVSVELYENDALLWIEKAIQEPGRRPCQVQRRRCD